MATIRIPPDFKEFLKLLNSAHVEYLIVGGYAVNYYGVPRATGDLDIWIAASQENASRLSGALRSFGFAQAQAGMFQEREQIIRMGVPPLRLEILTSISGVEFADCYARRQLVELDGIPANLIHLEDLKRNKRAAGRLKDRLDLEELS
jgi:hypothetical protein